MVVKIQIVYYWVIQRYLTAIRTYFTRWLIRTNSYDLTRTILYDLSKPQWRVGLGAGLGVGHLYEFVRISHLVKYVRIAVRLGWVILLNHWCLNAWRLFVVEHLILMCSWVFKGIFRVWNNLSFLKSICDDYVLLIKWISNSIVFLKKSKIEDTVNA